jgi:hypothetical protein
VLDELAGGPPERSQKWLDLVRGVPLLPVEAAIAEIVQAYIQHRVMPTDPAVAGPGDMRNCLRKRRAACRISAPKPTPPVEWRVPPEDFVMKINEHFETMDDCMVPILQAKTPAERLAICFGMWRHARMLVEAGVRHSHPHWTAEERNREAARRISHGAV